MKTAEQLSDVETCKRFVEVLGFLGGFDFPCSLNKSLVALRVPQLGRTRFLCLIHLVSQFRRLGLLVRRSCFIGKALAFDAQQRALGAGGIIIAGLDPVRIAKIEFCQIAVKVRLATMLVDADHAALEYREIALDGVGVDLHAGLAVGVAPFLAAVVDNAVVGELFADLSVLRRFIGHQVRAVVGMGAKDRNEVGLGDAVDVERAGAAAALNQSEDSVLMAASASDLRTFLAADEGFICFHRSAVIPHGRWSIVSHGFADAMGKKPSGFHAAFKHTLNLAGGDAFLAGAHQMDDLKPQMQRKVGTLKNSSLTHSELALAFVAGAKAKAGSLAFHLANAVRIGIAAMRAHWPIRPQLALDVGERGFFVLKAWIVENGSGHGAISYSPIHTPCGSLCQV